MNLCYLARKALPHGCKLRNQANAWISIVVLAASAACMQERGLDGRLFGADHESVSSEYIADAIDAAKQAQLQVPERGSRVLFSPVVGGAPVTGGERNMALLTVAAQRLGFEVYCATSPGEGLERLESHGVVGVADDDEQLRSVPPRLAASAVATFESELQAWQRNPNSVHSYDQVIAAFDVIESWALSGKPLPNEPSRTLCELESILLRGLRLRQVVRHHLIDSLIADTPSLALAGLLACAHTQTRVFSYAQSASPDHYDALLAGHTHVMAVSDVTARRFKDAPNVSIIRNGVNPRRFSAASDSARPIRAALGIPASAFVIGNTGVILDQKNQAAVLKAAIAASEVRSDVHVIFVGRVWSESYKADLDAIARSHQFENRVHYLGLRKDVDSILKELDVFVFPSLSESFGLSLAEAMATEVPAIACNLEAFHEFVGDTVALVDLGDDGTQMNAAIEAVMRYPDVAKARAQRSRQQILNLGFNTERMVKDFAVMLGAKPLAENRGVRSCTPPAGGTASTPCVQVRQTL